MLETTLFIVKFFLLPHTAAHEIVFNCLSKSSHFANFCGGGFRTFEFIKSIK
jgi:hypothetical protein